MEERKNYTNVNLVKGVSINRNVVREHTKPNDPNESGINCYPSGSAAKSHVIIGEAMTIYHMPIYKKLKELLETGVLGKVNLITMNFGSFKEYDMNNRFFNRNLAGGAMLDIGVYALSFIRWFMDSKPDQLLSQVKAAPTGVDEQAGLLLMNPEGQMATVMLSLHSKQPKRGMVSCEKGYIEIMEYPRAWEARITYVETGDTEVVRAGRMPMRLLMNLRIWKKR